MDLVKRVAHLEENYSHDVHGYIKVMLKLNNTIKSVNEIFITLSGLVLLFTCNSELIFDCFSYVLSQLCKDIRVELIPSCLPLLNIINHVVTLPSFKNVKIKSIKKDDSECLYYNDDNYPRYYTQKSPTGDQIQELFNFHNHFDRLLLSKISSGTYYYKIASNSKYMKEICLFPNTHNVSYVSISFSFNRVSNGKETVEYSRSKEVSYTMGGRIENVLLSNYKSNMNNTLEFKPNKDRIVEKYTLNGISYQVVNTFDIRLISDTNTGQDLGLCENLIRQPLNFVQHPHRNFF